MKIKFQNIIPEPLKESHVESENSVWLKPSLEFVSGDKMLVHAPSGKGKSTFLHILYGIRKDFSGELLFDGKSMGKASSARWDEVRKSKVSMVFQGLELFDHLSALENIQLKNAITEFKTRSDIEEMMDHLGIHHLQKQSAKTLSFGQKQRVAIVRALCQPCQWLLLDEPFSHLDEANSAKALELINDQASMQNAGVIITSLGQLSSPYFTQNLSL